MGVAVGTGVSVGGTGVMVGPGVWVGGLGVAVGKGVLAGFDTGGAFSTGVWDAWGVNVKVGVSLSAGYKVGVAVGV